VDAWLPKLEEWVERSVGRIGADIAHARCWGLLAAGRSNQQIADELVVVVVVVVVVDTVKKHVGHILDKLGAANRTQAVARARALGLLR